MEVQLVKNGGREAKGARRRAVRASKTAREPHPAPVAAAQGGAESRVSYADLAKLAPEEVINTVREGVPAVLIDDLVHDMKVSRTRVLAWMDIPEATAKRKIRQNVSLGKAEGEQALALARLVGQVGRMVRESGSPKGFDAPTWLAAWLSEPNCALGGACPGDYMDTAEGRALVAATLARMQSGAYA